MSDQHYPIVVVQDRYHGTYSNGEWVAIANCDGRYPERWLFETGEGPWGGDGEAMVFWDAPPTWIASGDTPDAAVAALLAKI